MLRNAVLVAGTRTPFVKAFGDLLKVDAVGLGVASVQGLLAKTNLDPKHVDDLIWGNVVLCTSAPNIAREVVIDLNLPRQIVAHSVSMACASGLKAVLEADTLIRSGHSDCIIAGGSDSMSNAEVPLPRNVTYGLAKGFVYAKGKNPIANVQTFFKYAGVNPLGWGPTPPSIAERSTGKTMGYHADLMAEINKISREDQDAYAVNSHAKALAARAKGYLKEEVVQVSAGKDKFVSEDNLLREQDPAKLKTLKPVFRKDKGTITAASSSALTDGGSSVLVMSEERAQKLGYPTDIRVKSWAFSAIDPYPQLLLAPALAIPRALEKAGLTLADIDIFEIHEAFAGQVLATTKVLACPDFARTFLNRDKAVGVVDPAKLNVNGGSLALGHPFAATGGRVVTAAMNELRRSQKRYALVSICAAGALGGVAIIERVPKN
eukprot:TRINITY_DN6978_c0_g1_i1.p1 TRINITY_DN6978_c0_g1~~TRINITY_DN6978_c0_g1_i1.p1  ORF type:complete len:469 (-),score=89.90 TRINITY_DN6978_c0_g1_i1:83-1384(-)